MRQRQIFDPVDRFWRRGLRVRLVDGRKVLQTFEPLRLEPPLPFIEAGPIKPALATSFGDIAKLLRQFQHAQTALSKLGVCIPLARKHCLRRLAHDPVILPMNSTERRLSGHLNAGLQALAMPIASGEPGWESIQGASVPTHAAVSPSCADRILTYSCRWR